MFGLVREPPHTVEEWTHGWTDSQRDLILSLPFHSQNTQQRHNRWTPKMLRGNADLYAYAHAYLNVGGQEEAHFWSDFYKQSLQHLLVNSYNNHVRSLYFLIIRTISSP